MFRHSGFFYLIGAPGQQGRHRLAAVIGGQDGHHFTVSFSVVRGQAGYAGDRKLRVRQQRFGQFVLLDDLDSSPNGLIVSIHAGGHVRKHFTIHTEQFVGIALGIGVLLDGIFAFGNGVRYRYAVRVGGHGGDDLPFLENIEHNASNRIAVQPVRFHEPNPALGGFVFTFHLIGFLVLRSRYRVGEAVIHIMLRHRGFLHFIHAPGEKIGDCFAVGIGGQGGDNLSIARAVM